ncbi:MAG: MBL fold metallo-hydrolase [Candidatus Hydrogenedentes bacterium]|nr:MBL fold metallo-hydrolase [Candidatus Hydrogenedentota bacterium]
MTRREGFRHSILCLAVLILLTGAAGAGELTVTFIGNSAFHITDGETTLLSDFPYRSGAYGYMEYDMDDVPPIENGLSLVTHSHADHWDKELFAKMDLSVIGPTSVTGGVDTEKVVPFDADEPMTFRDIEVQAIEMPHSLPQQHYSYLVTWHRLRLYFTGDTETPADILQREDIDIMFISPWLIRTIERQDLTLDTKVLVVYHQKIGEEFPPFQDYKRMKQGESFTVDFEVAVPAR